MKFNWKILVALVVIVGVIFWAGDSLRTRAYSGKNLNFGVGSGPVTVTNPSDSALPVQLVGTRASSFSVSSDVEAMTGRSERQGSGQSTTQVFSFELPPGVSVFTVGRGSDVSFVADVDTSLRATVEPMSAGEKNTTTIVAVVVVLGALFYISRSTGHRWINTLRGKPAVVPVVAPVAVSVEGGQGSALKAYGDNRAPK